MLTKTNAVIVQNKYYQLNYRYQSTKTILILYNYSNIIIQ